MKVSVIGIGPGHPDQITVQAVKALNAHKFILLPTKADTTTGDTRRAIALRHLENPSAHELIDLPMPQVKDRSTSGAYQEGISSFRDLQAQAIAQALDALDTDAAAILAWGCPTLYDGTIEGVKAYPGVELEVIPGVTSVSALSAAHGLVQTGIGQSVLVTTGRQLADGLPDGHGTIAVFVDSRGRALSHDDPDWDVYWGAYVGLEEETLIAGPLPDVREEILAQRETLAEEYGWLFDLTLLRKRDGSAHE